LVNRWLLGRWFNPRLLDWRRGLVRRWHSINRRLSLRGVAIDRRRLLWRGISRGFLYRYLISGRFSRRLFGRRRRVGGRLLIDGRLCRRLLCGRFLRRRFVRSGGWWSDVGRANRNGGLVRGWLLRRRFVNRRLVGWRLFLLSRGLFDWRLLIWRRLLVTRCLTLINRRGLQLLISRRRRQIRQVILRNVGRRLRNSTGIPDSLRRRNYLNWINGDTGINNVVVFQWNVIHREGSNTRRTSLHCGPVQLGVERDELRRQVGLFDICLCLNKLIG
jgi:hypothetical protein